MNKWSAAEDKWLKENRLKYPTYDELADALNQVCNSARTREAVKNRLRHTYGGIGRSEKIPYSEREKLYILKNYKGKTLRELAAGIYLITGRKVTKGAISHYMSDTLGITRCGRNHILQKGERIGYVAPIGSEYVNNDGYTFVKVSDTGIKNADWKTKQTVEWERLYGSKPNGLVVFLNGDRKDFSKDNLYCVSRKINLVMNSNKWFTQSREHTLTAIKWCELFYSLQEAKTNER